MPGARCHAHAAALAYATRPMAHVARASPPKACTHTTRFASAQCTAMRLCMDRPCHAPCRPLATWELWTAQDHILCRMPSGMPPPPPACMRAVPAVPQALHACMHACAPTPPHLVVAARRQVPPARRVREAAHALLERVEPHHLPRHATRATRRMRREGGGLMMAYGTASSVEADALRQVTSGYVYVCACVKVQSRAGHTGRTRAWSAAPGALRGRT